MAERPNSTALSQALALLGQFTDSVDSLPHDLTKAFGDLRELDAVLRSSMQGITTKVHRLIDMMQDQSVTPATRLCMLLEIAEDAQRLRMGSEDKIRVAGRTADDVAAHNQYNQQILNHLSDLDSSFDEALYVRRTTFPHVAPANLLPPTGEYALGRGRRRPPTGGVVQSSVSIGARLSAPMAVSTSAGGDKNKKRKLDEEEGRRTPLKGKEKDQRTALDKEREAADSRKAKKSRTQGSPTPSDSRHLGGRNFDQYPQPSAPASNGYSQQHPSHHQHHPGSSHGHHKSSTHAPPPQVDPAYAQFQPPYAHYAPQPIPGHDSKHSLRPGRTSSLLDVVASQPRPPNEYGHHHGFGNSPAFDEDDYVPVNRSNRPRDDGMRMSTGGRAGGYPNGNTYGMTHKETGGRGVPNDGGLNTPAGNSNANGSGEPNDVDDTRPYCYCDGVSYGEMIGCDDDQCRREWFHLGCLGMTAPPKGEWVCEECKARREKERAGKKSARSRGGGANRPSATTTSTPNGSAPPPNHGSHRTSVPPQQPASRNAVGK